MSVLVPLRDEGQDLGCQFIEVLEVGRPEALAPKNREPLLDLVHPGAVDRSVVELEARMLNQPGPEELALVDANVVANHMDDLDLSRGRAMDLGQQRDHLLLTLSTMQLAEDLARLDIEGGEEVACAFPLILVLESDGDQAWAGWLGLRRPGSRLNRSQLVERDNSLRGDRLARVEVEDVEHNGSERCITRNLGTQPVMDPPWFQA